MANMFGAGTFNHLSVRNPPHKEPYVKSLKLCLRQLSAMLNVGLKSVSENCIFGLDEISEGGGIMTITAWTWLETIRTPLSRISFKCRVS